MAQVTCYIHEGAKASASCHRCLKSICTVCGIFDGAREYCPSCLKAVRRGRTIRRSAIVALVAVVVALGVYRSRGTLPAADGKATFDYGKLAEQVAALRTSLNAEPCDRALIIRYTDRLLEAGDNRGTLAAADAFTQKCGEYPRLWWQTYTAHQRLSEFEAAAAEATRLIERYPEDHDYRWWRGQAWEEKGDLEQALGDYRQALALTPTLRSIPLNIVSVQERLGRPCEALATLEQYFFQYPKLREEPKLRVRRDSLNSAGDCGRYSGKGQAMIRFQPSSGVIHTTAELNGKRQEVVVDTGASFVSISRAFAEKLKLELKPRGKIRLMTAAGARDGVLASLESVKVQGATASDVEVVVVDDLPENTPALLGLSFLSRFDVKLDARAGTLSLASHATTL